MKKTVIIQFSVDGFHRYPNAPKEVEFLSNQHRHTFLIKCGFEVTDSNREKEIFICRDEIKNYINECYGVPAQFNDMSCEMIAEDILDFGLNDNMIWCEVWEEKTGGASVKI